MFRHFEHYLEEMSIPCYSLENPIRRKNSNFKAEIGDQNVFFEINLNLKYPDSDHILMSIGSFRTLPSGVHGDFCEFGLGGLSCSTKVGRENFAK